MDLFQHWLLVSRYDLQRYSNPCTVRRRRTETRDKKGKVSITPPTSPVSTSSFSFQQNGYYNNNIASSPRPRILSDSSDPGIDGHFRFLEGYSTDDVVEVFAISDGKVNNDTLSHRSNGSKPGSTAGTLPGVRDSFPEDKYKWNDTETSVNNTPKQTNKRKICFIVFITILVLALIGVGVAVILVYKVFDVGEKEELVLTTVRPEILCLEGSLDLKETWTDELTNPNSSLYISTANNFTLEMDKVMKNSSYADTYIRTYVTGFSPGSIKVKFKMLHNYGFKKNGRTAPQFAEEVEEHLVRSAPQTNLPIDSRTIEIRVCPLVTTTVAPTTTEDGLPSESAADPLRIIATATSTFASATTSIVTSAVASPSTLASSPNRMPTIISPSVSAPISVTSTVISPLASTYTVISPLTSTVQRIESAPILSPSFKELRDSTSAVLSYFEDTQLSVISDQPSAVLYSETLRITPTITSHPASVESPSEISNVKTSTPSSEPLSPTAALISPSGPPASLSSTLAAISPSAPVQSPAIVLSPSTFAEPSTVFFNVISPKMSVEAITLTLTIVFPSASPEPLTVTSTVLYPLSASLTVTCAPASYLVNQESPNFTSVVKYSSASTEQSRPTNTVAYHSVLATQPIVPAALLPYSKYVEPLSVTSRATYPPASAEQLSVTSTHILHSPSTESPSVTDTVIPSVTFCINHHSPPLELLSITDTLIPSVAFSNKHISPSIELQSVTDTVIPSVTFSNKHQSPTEDLPSSISSYAPSELLSANDTVIASSLNADLHTLTESVIPNATSNFKHQELPSVNDTVTSSLTCSEISNITENVISPSASAGSISVTSDQRNVTLDVISSLASVDTVSVTPDPLNVTSVLISSSESVLSSEVISTFVSSSSLNTVSASETRESSNSSATLSTAAIVSSSTVPSTSQTYFTDKTSVPTTSSSSSSTSTTRTPETSTTTSSSSSSATTSTPSTTTSSSTTTTSPTTSTTTTTTPTTTPTTTTSTTTKSTTTTTPSTTKSTTTPSTTKSTTTTTTPSTTTTTTPSTTTSSTTTTPSTTTSTTTTTPSTTTTTPSTTTTTTTPSTTTSTTTTTKPSTTTSTPATSTSTTSTTTKTTTTTEPDRPPIAHAGSDIIITLPKRTAVLDGSASTDDKGITSYLWEKLSPDSVNIGMVGEDSKVLSVSDLVEGIFVFRLTVSDKLGQIDQDAVTVTVKPAPTTPTTTTSTTPRPDLCLPVDFEMCASRGFTMTSYPNFFSHESGIEAEEAFNISVERVINQLCQETAIQYMCSLYFPKCDPDSGIFIIPCKSLCEASESSCGNYFSNPFPCKDFPDTDCVGLPTTTVAPTTTTVQPKRCEPTTNEQCKQLGFNETMFPNFFFEPDQRSAMVTFENYLKPFFGCHEDAAYFVCSIQFPKCLAGINMKPCRQICEAVVAACPDIGPFFQCSSFKNIDCLSPPKPTAQCTQNEFTCGRVTKCISEDRVCNGVDDCGDWTDEMDCVCSEYEYKCDMGMCIKSYQRCDGESQCPDNSDEQKCDGCTHGAVKCPSGECIMSEWLCDGRKECKDGWDEYDCDVCGYNQFTCADRGRTCIDLSKRCDGTPNCPEGYDEWDCINHEKGILEISYLKYNLPVCAASWHDYFGDYTCTELLGEGAYIDKTDIAYNLHAFANISDTGRQQSVLGPWDLTYDCPGSKAVRINCQPRGCGKRMVESLSPWVVGGENADPGEWPWHVALYFGGQYFCGGTLISDTFVLTAAHCVEKFNRDFSLMTVQLGATNRKASETTQHVIKVEAIESHEDHVYFKKNDIALLQLEGPVTFTKYIQPICLPEPDDPLPLFSTCFTIGWGKTKWDGDYAEVLQRLKMTLWDTKKCNSSIAWNGEVYDTFLCAGYYSGVRSICKKDSGGPLLCLDRDKTWKLRGINSYVGNYCNMTERPNVFTNISMFRGWLNDKIECKFRCDNGKCLYYKDQLCDRVDHCGDNSDEVRVCNRTVSCDFEDKFLCGYEFNGWKLGYDNKFAASIEIDGQTYTQSNAPQYDHTVGRYPGNFFYGKQKNVREAEMWSPRVSIKEQTCIRFAYYQRGSIKMGLVVQYYLYHRSGNYTVKRARTYGIGSNSLDEWKTGYFDIAPEDDFKLLFRTADLLSAAIDDIVMIPGMCSDVLCRDDEFRCKGRREYNHKCIPKQLHCNLAIDCDDGVDEKACSSQETYNYTCTFENGNLCALYQEVGDASDWWLVNASFVRDELSNRAFVDHSTMTVNGFLFYINTNNLQTSSNHIYMWQLFYLQSKTYCFTFYYQMKSKVNFNIHVRCPSCTEKTYMAQSTFDDKWTLFQIDLPTADVVNITYDVEGTQKSDGFLRSFIALDDIVVKPGVCPQYVCRNNYTKCKSYDRCIPASALCDRKVDCLDESDEEQCVCKSNEYRCASGRCIPEVYKCDREPQCRDSSDEGDVCQSLKSVSCTFEHPYMCGYDFLQYTRFRWERNQGGTSTHFTGPEKDHTYLNETGHYMYTEANNGNSGDNATLLSPVFFTGPGQSVLFYYHLYSLDITQGYPGILQLSIENVQMQTNTVVWRANPNDLKDEWRDVCKDLPSYSQIRLWFTVIRNETTIYGVDMAIDDVKLDSHPCKELTSPSPATTAGPTTQQTTTQGSNCEVGEFECGDGTCVPGSYRCDDVSDCRDSSDEFNCP